MPKMWSTYTKINKRRKATKKRIIYGRKKIQNLENANNVEKN
jgi:hypothetical protein